MERRSRIDADRCSIRGDIRLRCRGPDVHEEHGRRAQPPSLLLLTRLEQRRPFLRTGVWIEPSAAREPVHRIERSRHEDGVHVVGIASAREPVPAVTPVAGGMPRLEADEILGGRPCRESRRAPHDPEKIADERSPLALALTRAVALARALTPALAELLRTREKCRRSRTSPRVIEQPPG